MLHHSITSISKRVMKRKRDILFIPTTAPCLDGKEEIKRQATLTHPQPNLGTFQLVARLTMTE
jgi:hypothetical protein